MLGQVDGSAPHHGEDQLVQGTVVVDASDSTSWRSHDAPNFGLEPVLSAISPDEDLVFQVCYISSGEVDKPSPNLRKVWKTVVKSVSKDWNVCIKIYRYSKAPVSAVVLQFTRNFDVAHAEISVVLMQEFVNAVLSNQRIPEVHIEAPYSTLGRRFRTLVMNMFQVIMESPSLQFVTLHNYEKESGLPLDRAAVKNLVSALRRNLTLTRFRIDNGGHAFLDTDGFKLFLEPLMIGGRVLPSFKIFADVQHMHQR